jgi:hypothetical protein
MHSSPWMTRIIVPFLIVYACCCKPVIVPVLQSLGLLLLMCYTICAAVNVMICDVWQRLMLL